jgi:DNA-binding PadR family transcriptional regulator
MGHSKHDHNHEHQHGHDNEGMHEHIHEHLHDHFSAARGMWGPRGRWGGPGGGWGGGRRIRRGHIRTAVLVSLKEESAHGYEIMRRLEEMSGGLWRPSPGSVYPTLQMLEDEGLVRSSEINGSRTYTLTDTGRAEADSSSFPGSGATEGEEQLRSLRQAVGQLVSAAKQLSGAGENSQVLRGIAVIQRARKELYQILGED